MKAAQIEQYGGENALKLVDGLPRPVAAANEIVVEVHAAATNPFDWKLREGILKDYFPLELPAILGGDVAGVVSEIGSDVVGFAVGQAVYGMANAVGGHGSFAEYTPVLAHHAVSKPQSVDFVTAAALPLVAVSAYQGLIDHSKLQANQKVLIHGGAGGIGSVAIQVAKHIGAYVATTVSAKDIEYVKALGADEVIDYSTQDFSTLLSGYDVVFDTVGGETGTKSYAVLKKGGIFVSMAQPVDEALAAEHGITYIQQGSTPTPERLQAITTLVDDGVIKINVDTVFPFDEAPAALEYLKTGHPRGKVVIRVKD